MHCLFLGIAKWITKRIWIDEGILTDKDLQSIQKKMNGFEIPSDLGRILVKFTVVRDSPILPLTSGETFS
jgi:hypothetical protein